MVSSTPRPHLGPGKTRYQFYRRLGGPQGRSGQVENLVPTGIFFLFWSFIIRYSVLHEYLENIVKMNEGMKLLIVDIACTELTTFGS